MEIIIEFLDYIYIYIMPLILTIFLLFKDIIIIVIALIIFDKFKNKRK